MPMNFPDSPTTGQNFTSGGVVWKWDGLVWNPSTTPGGGAYNVTIADAAPVNLSAGNLWWNSSPGVGQLYLYYDDGTSKQWVAASTAAGPQGPPGTGGGGASVTIADAAPTTPVAGNLWWNSTAGDGQLYIYYTDPNTSQWVIANNMGGGLYLPLAGGTINPGPLIINANAAAPPTDLAPKFRIMGADGQSAYMVIDSPGSFPQVIQRASGGTGAAPTALAAGAQLGNLNFGGYDGSAWVANNAACLVTSVGAWTTSNHGTMFYWFTTPQGSTSSGNIATLSNAGGFQALGTPTNDNAPAGWVGEFVSSTVPSTSPVALSSSTATNITSISLTAGDWDVEGNVGCIPSGGTGAQNFLGWVNNVSAAAPAVYGSEGFSIVGTTLVEGLNCIQSTGRRRFSLAVTTTIYLGTYLQYTGGTANTYGTIRARRIR